MPILSTDPCLSVLSIFTFTYLVPFHFTFVVCLRNSYCADLDPFPDNFYLIQLGQQGNCGGSSRAREISVNHTNIMYLNFPLRLLLFLWHFQFLGTIIKTQFLFSCIYMNQGIRNQNFPNEVNFEATSSLSEYR